ncbi:Flp pilus assembly complex ATPase component TadA [Pseudomonas inefficax]|uniref:GspE/PulE family protein n=1 Tax=Pseudomonas inefficax TaxID=2078786 RepID=UPI00207BB038|nr:ATPase, T2SS/T4P/T4SS family [Pseudomonas inefficax]MCM8915457.1 Flp pilus assembly complex ATPase component TadA [Pseudomonas inefficax]
MDITDSLVERLVEGGRLTSDALGQIVTLRAKSPQGCVTDWLLRLGLLSEASLAQAWSATLGWQRFDPETSVTPDAALPPLPLRFLNQHCVVPVGIAPDGQLQVVVARPAEAYPLRAIAYATGLKVFPLVGTRSEIEQMIETLYGQGRSVMGSLVEQFEDLEDPESIDHLKDLASEAPVIRLVNLILQRAMELRASDVHIEPFENRLNVRYRIDGLLREAESPPVRSAAAVISRIKIMARLDIAERRLPQDGRIALRLSGRQIDLRVSTLPTSFGESVVLRLLDRTSVTLEFEQLGFSGRYLDRLLDVLEQPNGILLVTGPTGSGKTTTLYTALARLNTTERKIITVEDPVEYQLDGVNQLQVKPAIGLDFATALRSIVRQDPDVIMIGEIRDLETCRIAIQSALTGHLVLSTLHTNSASASITRLLDMGAESYLLASTLNGVLAQRLLRRLDPEQCEAFEAPPALVREHRLEHYTDERPIRLYRPRTDAFGGGYRGRVVVSELLVMSERIRAMLMERADSSALERVAREEGLRTLYEDGLRLALAGVTSLEEVLRVTRDEGEQAA